ncbi:hypothetical protein ABK040_004555 [Willaertia magna]
MSSSSLGSSTAGSGVNNNKNNNNNNNSILLFPINIRFANSGDTYTLELLNNQNIEQLTISELIEHIKNQIILKNEHLVSEFNLKPIVKLIYQGKLLNVTQTIGFYKISPESFIHCTLAERRQQDVVNTSTLHQQRNISGVSGAFRMGFDALMNAGFSREDVIEIRNQFYSTRGYLLQQLRSGQLTQQDLYQLEQQWMNETHQDQNGASGTTNTLFNNNNPTNSNQQQLNTTTNNTATTDEAAATGSIYHFMFGLLFGFFFGIISAVALLEKTIPKSMNLGIQVGFIINLFCGILRFFFPSIAPYIQ